MDLRVRIICGSGWVKFVRLFSYHPPATVCGYDLFAIYSYKICSNL